MRVVTIALGSMLLLGGTAGSAAGTIAYAYDARGRLVQVTRVVNSGTPVVTAYTFDKADNRIGKTTTGTATASGERARARSRSGFPAAGSRASPWRRPRPTAPPSPAPTALG